MREERGQLSGDLIVHEPFNLWGSIGGNVRVVQGGKFYVRGAIYGNLTVEYGGRVHVFGNISGDLIVERGAKVIHSGILGGDAINNGGRLYVERASRVLGKVKTVDGKTTVEPGFKSEGQ
jgi:cytoskeletal protein CcmA (bactofilin family)